MEDSLSSGYSSQTSTGNGYDNNVNNVEDVSSKRKEGTSKSGVTETEIKESVYDRIHKFDHEDDRSDRTNHILSKYVNKKEDSNQSRPLPPLPDEPNYSKFKQHRNPLLRIRFASLLLVLIIVGAVTIYIWRSCYRDWLCSKNGGIPIDPSHPCDAQTFSNYSSYWNSTCTLDLYNPTALLLQSEGAESARYDLDNGNSNVTIKGLVFTLSRQSESLSVDIEIEKVNCSTVGTYLVTLTNGTHNETFRVNVKVNPTTQQCPCNLECDAGNASYIECVTSPSVNVSVILHADRSEVVLAENINIGEIMTNGSIQTDGLSGITLTARTTSSGALFSLNLSPVKCDHDGTYAIVLGNTSYETVFTVKSYPRTPIIGIDHDELGGLVQGEYGEVRCEAFVGCGQAPTLYEKVFDRYEPVQVNKSSLTNKTDDDGVTFYEEKVFEKIIPNNNNTQYMCNFTYKGQSYQSKIYTARVVPENYCEMAGIAMNCNGRHPYDCTKFITCTTRAWERHCDRNLHFYFKEKDDTCHGKCGFAKDANCPL